MPRAQLETEKEVPPEGVRLSRDPAARANYLSAAKEVCRHTSKLNDTSVAGLERVDR